EQMMSDRKTDDIVDILAGLALFADLTRPQLQAVAHTFEEEWFTEGQRILRQGFTGSNFYVILEGEAVIRINGETRATLGRGEFFGEVSVLLGEPPTADVVALRPLRCIALAGTEAEAFLTSYPRVMFRMLQAQARRLRSANLWRS
ncbi:MAG TPA: cyclic nucleotide-binding domain-containing protein, partial [bacterium]|nr:cyclic nucleotide-binding domain-containing protein [bacterium]